MCWPPSAFWYHWSPPRVVFPPRRSRSARIVGTRFERANRGSWATLSSASSPASTPSRNPMRQRAVGPHHRRIGHGGQLVVGRADGGPVGLLPGRCRCVHRGDNGLRQVGAGRPLRLPQPVQPVCDAATVPAVTVLFVERYQCAGRVDAGRPSRIMQQHKGCQACASDSRGHQGAQFTGQPHALVAEFVADRRRTGGGPVALGEHRVDAREHVGGALGSISAGGTRNGMLAPRIFCLARVMR